MEVVMSTLLSFVAALVIIVVDVVVVSGLPPDWLKVDVDSSEPP